MPISTGLTKKIERKRNKKKKNIFQDCGKKRTSWFLSVSVEWLPSSISSNVSTRVRGIAIWFSLSIRCPVVEQESPFLRPRPLIRAGPGSDKGNERRTTSGWNTEKCSRKRDTTGRKGRRDRRKGRTEGGRKAKAIPRHSTYKLRNFRDLSLVRTARNSRGII